MHALRAVCGATLLIGLVSNALDQQLPMQQIRMVVPTTAGGSSDIRLVALDFSVGTPA